ncbi:MAG: YkgJ family cysteine cluster protein [Synergistales bacterium]|nr:YkgJ family cysteine cluster protein [Synergistales bacterium]
MQETESLCARCARLGKTCCQTCEIYVTPGDVARIEAFTGQTGFYEFRVPDDPVYLDQDDDPEWAACVFRPDGSRRVLKRKADGDCVFLGPRGCQLPLEVRPLVCRLYPINYTARGLEPELAKGCPVQLLPPGMGLLEALDMSRSQAEIWHRQLYAEIRLEPHARLGESAVTSSTTATRETPQWRVDGPVTADKAAPAGPVPTSASERPVAGGNASLAETQGARPAYPVAKAP